MHVDKVWTIFKHLWQFKVGKKVDKGSMYFHCGWYLVNVSPDNVCSNQRAPWNSPHQQFCWTTELPRLMLNPPFAALAPHRALILRSYAKRLTIKNFIFSSTSFQIHKGFISQVISTVTVYNQNKSKNLNCESTIHFPSVKTYRYIIVRCLSAVIYLSCVNIDSSIW